MKRISLLGLGLALLVGCHHNTIPHHVTQSQPFSTGDRRFESHRSQVAFVSPMGMNIGWETSMGGGKQFMPAQVVVPGRYNFAQGAIYRLRVDNVESYPNVPFYPTLEVAPTSPRSDAYLAHNAIPIEMTDEDFQQVSTGNFVTKVIYLPDPDQQQLAIAGVETLVSTRLDPGVDPLAEADRRGTILAILRMGGIDLELPQAGSVSQYAGPQNQSVIVSNQPQGGGVVSVRNGQVQGATR